MSEAKAAGAVLTMLTAEQLESIVTGAVRKALEGVRAHDGWYDTASAAVYLKTSVRSVQHAVARRTLVPDHHGQRPGGLKGNRFSKATLDAFLARRAG